MDELDVVAVDEPIDEPVETLTREDVAQVVSDALDARDYPRRDALDTVAADVRSVGDAVASLVTAQETAQEDGVATYSVVVDADQWAYLRTALRTVCSLTFFSLMLSGVLVGLLGWRVLADRWRSS